MEMKDAVEGEDEDESDVFAIPTSG
jgi:hypothetical protein